jgi:GAF domain-containing protein
VDKNSEENGILTHPIPVGDIGEENAAAGSVSTWDSNEYFRVNQATQQIAQTDSPEQIMEITTQTISRSPYYSLHFTGKRDRLILQTINAPSGKEVAAELIDQWWGVTFSVDPLRSLLDELAPIALDAAATPSLPWALETIFSQLSLKSVVLLPVWQHSRVAHLFVLGAQAPGILDPGSAQPYTILVSYVSTALEKIRALEHLQRRVSALQSIASISQAISETTDLDELYELIHEKITQVMGEVDLVVAIYNPDNETIHIPYAHEGNETLHIDPFPLGEGLTSILIRTQQPLILVEDTEKRAAELGAKIAGATAKSWLGAPLIVSGDVIGAIIVQDVEYEHRFDNDDLRLLTTIASQVAVTIRNIRLLQEAEQRAARERMITEITKKLWTSAEIDTIARTAIEELGRVMHASRAAIQLRMPDHGR